jgi:RNA polymerase sigma-70 factor (ECF subfamily)
VDRTAEIPSESDDPEAGLLRGELREVLARAVRTLPDPFREVVILREIQDLSYREISEVTGVPVGTVMSRLARARRRLQQVLEAQGMEG